MRYIGPHLNPRVQGKSCANDTLESATLNYKANQLSNLKKSLRLFITRQCNTLSSRLKRQKSQAILNILETRPEFRYSQHIAAYWPFKGEADPRPLLKKAFYMKKHCYLPVLHPSKPGQLLFVEYKAGDKLALNRYGIREPLLRCRKIINAWRLNLVFVPLIAFTKKGQRLGRGGGYYDRTFAFTKNTRKVKHPKLIGLAYDLQGVEELPHEKWDILLTGVATDKRFIISTR
jgi:5-formyltetrahydrofolate cyclo-ligase